MSGFKAKEVPFESGNKERPKPMESGTYPARLVQIMVLGSQKQRPYKGEEKAPVRELMLTYEFLDEFLKDEDGEDILEKPRWLSETIPFHNLEADLAKSTKRYYALDPTEAKGGDWSELLGTPCMVTVVLNEGKGKNAGNMYENISAVSAMRPKEAAKAPELVNPTKAFDFYGPDPEVYAGLPKWIQEKLKEAVDFEGSALEEMLNGTSNDDGPPKKKPKAKVKEEEEEQDDGDGADDDEIPW